MDKCFLCFIHIHEAETVIRWSSPICATSTCFLPQKDEPVTRFGFHSHPSLLCRERYRIQSCGKLTCLLTIVAQETVAKGEWALPLPESPHRHTVHAHAHAHIFLSSLEQFSTEFRTLRHRGFKVVLETSNGLLSIKKRNIKEDSSINTMQIKLLLGVQLKSIKIKG